jgi:hypothetical protein
MKILMKICSIQWYCPWGMQPMKGIAGSKYIDISWSIVNLLYLVDPLFLFGMLD